MTTIEPSVFHAAFDNLPTPALLKTSSGWLANPAAKAAGFPETTLDELLHLGRSDTVWVNQTFYHASVSKAQEDFLVLLQPDAFLASGSLAVANQFRQHLTAAFSSIYNLTQTDAVSKIPDSKPFVSSLNLALFRMLRAVQQLDFCATSSSLSLRLQYVDLVDLLQSFAENVCPLCRERGVTLDVTWEPDYLPTAADPEQLTTLFLHLLSNALKYAPPEDVIALSLKQQGENAVFTLTDSGGTLPPDILTTPLWSQPNRLEFNRGLGLGLPIAQHIAAAHGGSLMALYTGKTPRLVVSLPIRDFPGTLASPSYRFTNYAGFDPAKVILSDALPSSLYFPKLDDEDL